MVKAALRDQRVFQKVVDEIISYVVRDMRLENGGFYSAEDADSQGEEGVFYVWKIACPLNAFFCRSIPMELSLTLKMMCVGTGSGLTQLSRSNQKYAESTANRST